MNNYLYKRLVQLKDQLDKLRELSVLKVKLEAKLASITAEFDEAKKSFDVQDAEELVELVNQVEHTFFKLDSEKFEVEDCTEQVQKDMEEIKEVCGDCEAFSGSDCVRTLEQGCLKEEREKIEEPRVESRSEQPQQLPEEPIAQTQQTTAELEEKVEEKTDKVMNELHSVSFASLFSKNNSSISE